MRRWLVLPIGLGLAAAAAWVLLADVRPAETRGKPAGPASHDEIRPESREQLREILRDAEETP